MRKPSQDILETLASNIRKLRSEKGLSQEELSYRSGLHRTYVGAVERKEKNPTLASLELFANALETNISYLLLNHSE